MCSPTPSIFDFSVFSSVFNLESLLRALILRVLLRVQYFWQFWRLFWNGLVNLAVISTRSGLCDPPIFLDVSAPVSGLLFFWTLLSGGFCGICLLFPCVQGYPKVLEGLLRAGEQCLEKSSTCRLVCLTATKNFSTGYLLCYPAGLLWYPYLILILQRKIEWNRGNRRNC